MRAFLLFVASPQQIASTKKALQRLRATPVEPTPYSKGEDFEVTHPSLGDLILEITLLDDIDKITPHLRQNAVDLLIYDERGEGGIDAPSALAQIRDDIQALGDLWGPDFYFPMRRVVAILEREDNQAMRAFELGRVHVRDVFIAPQNTATLLRWLARALSQGIIRTERIGMAMSGGGTDGFLYQLGCVYALDRAFGGRNLDECHVYSGVSSGAIAATALSGKVSRSELIRAVRRRSNQLPSLTAFTLYDFAAVEIIRRIAKGSVKAAGLNPRRWLETTLRNVPTGLFKGERLEEYFREIIRSVGGNDQFSDLESELYIGATDQDTYEHVVFGKEPWHTVPISEALRASVALPPVFTPKRISGRQFIDGQVTKSTNLELVVERGCRLVIVLDPLKPMSTAIPGTVDRLGGVYATIQTIKALISTRFEASLGLVADRFPDVDFLVFQPDEECAQIMAGNPMRLRLRTSLVEMAYRSTLRQLRERHHVYARKLERFGFRLKEPDELRLLENQRDEVFSRS